MRADIKFVLRRLLTPFPLHQPTAIVIKKKELVFLTAADDDDDDACISYTVLILSVEWKWNFL